MTEITTMSPKIAAAISAVMTEIPMLKKGGKNTHGNYNFASIDDFLEAIRPLCAKNGLIIMQNEEEFTSDAGWLTMKFRFTLAHSSGETFDGGCRSILVNGKMGSQAFGAAQSYALKQYMRSLFQVSTGEKGNDIDEHAATDLPQKTGVIAAAVNNAEPAKPTGITKLKADLKAFSGQLKEVETSGDLESLLDEYATALEDCKEKIPSWWNGDPKSPDVPGFFARIEAAKQATGAYMSAG